MRQIGDLLDNINSVGIGGHIRPDGDCVGSCMALYLYLRENYPRIRTDVYLDRIQPVFTYIRDIDDIKHQADPDVRYDLFITCDVSARSRLAVAGDCYDRAGLTVCIDHHVSNPGFAMINHVRGEVSSTCEVLYSLLDHEKISVDVAAALYTGIVHDTGVFQYPNTTPETMAAAGELMKKGFDFSRIIETSFYEKSYVQNQVMGRVLTESILLLDGRCVVGYLKKKDMDFYGVEGTDLDGIVSQLRLTAGVEVAMFLYELRPEYFKVSLRSKRKVDVSKIAVYFGGGGHNRAAGCEMNGSVHDVINNVMEQVELALNGDDGEA